MTRESRLYQAYARILHFERAISFQNVVLQTIDYSVL
jgi:hypothetical protein